MAPTGSTPLRRSERLRLKQLGEAAPRATRATTISRAIRRPPGRPPNRRRQRTIVAPSSASGNQQRPVYPVAGTSAPAASGAPISLRFRPEHQGAGDDRAAQEQLSRDLQNLLLVAPDLEEDGHNDEAIILIIILGALLCT